MLQEDPPGSCWRCNSRPFRPGWARNCDRFKIAARTMAIGLGSQPALFGTASAKMHTPMGKTRGKTTRESSKSGEKWRFFEGLKRHFALLGAEVAQAQAIHFRGFISVEPGWCAPPRFPRIGCRAPFSNRARYKPTTLRSPGEGRSDVTREAGCAKNATMDRTCGRHGHSALPATMPGRSMALYLDAYIWPTWNGLCAHLNTYIYSCRAKSSCQIARRASLT